MLLEYWIVIVQGFKQHATGNMDDPYLIPGMYLIRSSCLTCSETCSKTLFEAGGVPCKMAESMWLHTHLIQDLISISRTSVPKYRGWCCEIGYFVVVDDLELE
ncbi:hypothetical protein C5167_015092 [Papaver somniferum]|uniref:Uncharacterized protein n=1 Tax=Papaver somniferum TaxID=3469 RepID=A0A4Y7J510_PAPSO|nr:hypothetical protein C5167_015092 [Papaver somniferum]